MSKKKQCRTKKPTSAAKSPNPPHQIPRHEQQLAVIGDVVLDIEAAFQLLRTTPRRRERIDVEAWARLYGMDGNPHAPISIGPLFDPEHAQTADLRRPLIVVTFTTARGDDVQLIADGSHRLYRAFREGHDSLPALVLNATETSAITITGGTTSSLPSQQSFALGGWVTPGDGPDADATGGGLPPALDAPATTPGLSAGPDQATDEDGGSDADLEPPMAPDQQ